MSILIWYVPALWLLIGIAWLLSACTDSVKLSPAVVVAIVVCVIAWPIAAPLNWYMARLARRRVS